MPSKNSNDAALTALVGQAIALSDHGEHQAALDLLVPAAKRRPRSAALAGLVARNYFEAEDFEHAAVWFHRITELSPKSELASLGLFHSLWRKGETTEAFEEMQRFLILAESEEYDTLLHDLASAGQLQAKLEPAGAAS